MDSEYTVRAILCVSSFMYLIKYSDNVLSYNWMLFYTQFKIIQSQNNKLYRHSINYSKLDVHTFGDIVICNLIVWLTNLTKFMKVLKGKNVDLQVVLSCVKCVNIWIFIELEGTCCRLALSFAHF